MDRAVLGVFFCGKTNSEVSQIKMQQKLHLKIRVKDFPRLYESRCNHPVLILHLTRNTRSHCLCILIDMKFLKQDTCSADDGVPTIKELVFFKEQMEDGLSQGISGKFTFSDAVLLSMSPMAYENMGKREEYVLLLMYYIPLRRTQ